MSRREKILYHQIHPLKLMTDLTAACLSFYFFWRHRLRAGLVAQLVPPIIVSAALIQWADLEPYKRSSFGQYIAQHMTRRMEAIRLLGNIVMSVAAWYRRPFLMFVGLLIIAFGWLKGKILG